MCILLHLCMFGFPGHCPPTMPQIASFFLFGKSRYCKLRMRIILVIKIIVSVIVRPYNSCDHDIDSIIPIYVVLSSSIIIIHLLISPTTHIYMFVTPFTCTNTLDYNNCIDLHQ